MYKWLYCLIFLFLKRHQWCKGLLCQIIQWSWGISLLPFVDCFCRLDASHRGSAWRQGNQGKLCYTVSPEISRSRSKFWSILVFPWKVRKDFIVTVTILVNFLRILIIVSIFHCFSS